MKLILLSIFILFIYNIKNINCGCTQYQCLNQGESCIKKGTNCPPNTYCEVSYDNPLCVNSKKILETCTYQSQCSDGLICYNSGDDQFCANVKYKGQGEACKKDLECSDSMTCTNKTCTYSLTSCKSTSCKAGQYCNSNSKCVSKSIDGTICLNDIECNPNSRCIVTSNPKISKCTPLNSLSAGLPCSSSTDACDISLNLVCYKGYCTEFNKGLESNSTCSNNDECITDKSLCICDSVNKPDESGTCTQTLNVGVNCKNAKVQYFDCLTNSGCPLLVTNQNSNETCVYSKCSDLKCKYESECLLSDYYCGKGPICSDSNSLLKSTSISLFLLLSIISYLIL